MPYVFEPKPSLWDTFRVEVATELGISRTDMRIVGSGRFGFSMTPGRNFDRFTDQSDIDLIIINPHLFDHLWVALLEAAYPRGEAVARLGGWLTNRRDELYTGWLTPTAITLDRSIFGSKAEPVLKFRVTWFNAIKRASRHPPRRHSDINGRLYRT